MCGGLCCGFRRKGGGGRGQCESGLRKYDHRFGALSHQTGFSDLC